MSNKNIHKIGFVNKCGGIPKFPNKFEFHWDEPVEFSENHIKARRKRLAKFLDEYGIELVDWNYLNNIFPYFNSIFYDTFINT